MTNEEAIRKLEYSKKAYQMLIDEKVDSGKLVGKDIKGEWKADTPLDEAYKSMIDALEMAIQSLEQEPCEDAITRILKKMWNCRGKHTTSIDKVKMERIIRDELPPVTPQEPTDKSNLEKICEELAAENDDLRDQLAMRDRFKHEPCNDAISREDVEECKELMTDINGDTVYAVRMSDIRRLSPVTSKTGHWTRELIRNEKGGCIGAKMICSECGQDNGYDKRMKFCPNCGAEMAENEE